MARRIEATMESRIFGSSRRFHIMTIIFFVGSCGIYVLMNHHSAKGIFNKFTTVGLKSTAGLEVARLSSSHNKTHSKRNISVNDGQRREWLQQFLRSKERALSDPGFNSQILNLLNHEQVDKNDDDQEPISNSMEIDSHYEGPEIKVGVDNGLIEFVDAESCEPISPDLLLYNRIFKTGSTTMSELMKFMGKMMDFVFVNASTEDFYDTGISRPYPMIIENVASSHRDQRVLFDAHFFFRNNLKTQRAHTYINQVREPVARFISHYTYMRSPRDRGRPRRVEQMIKSGEMAETIEQCFENQHQGCRYNVMTRFFCGPEPYCKTGSNETLAKAKENILRHYAVVGLLEHFDLYLKILNKRFPFFFPLVPNSMSYKAKVTSRKSNMSSVPAELIEKIKAANRADIELYQFIEQLFWRQVKSCGSS